MNKNINNGMVAQAATTNKAQPNMEG